MLMASFGQTMKTAELPPYVQILQDLHTTYAQAVIEAGERYHISAYLSLLATHRAEVSPLLS